MDFEYLWAISVKMTIKIPTQNIHTFITGVSSGIGRALAENLLDQGYHVSGMARRNAELDNLSAKYDQFLGISGDVTDRNAVTDAIHRAESHFGEINQAILNAGTYIPQADLAIDPELFRQQFDINYMGQVNALAVLLPLMEARQNGHIVLMASVAGWRGLPLAASYGPTKAASISLAESLFLLCQKNNIKLQVACPGFVDTEATAQNNFRMPMLMTAPDAAKAIIKGMQSSAFMISFPLMFALSLKLLRILPYRWYFWIVKRMTGQK